MNIAHSTIGNAVSSLQAAAHAATSELKPGGVDDGKGSGSIKSMGSNAGALPGIQISRHAIDSISGANARVLDALPMPGSH